MPLAPVLWFAGPARLTEVRKRGRDGRRWPAAATSPTLHVVPRPEKKEKTNKKTSESHTTKGSLKAKKSLRLKEVAVYTKTHRRNFSANHMSKCPILTSDYRLVIVGLKLPIKHIYRWCPVRTLVTVGGDSDKQPRGPSGEPRTWYIALGNPSHWILPSCPLFCV